MGLKKQTIIPRPYAPKPWPADVPLADMPSTASVMSGPSRSMYASFCGQSEDGHSIYLPGVNEGLKSGFEEKPRIVRRAREPRQRPLLGQGFIGQAVLRFLEGGR